MELDFNIAVESKTSNVCRCCLKVESLGATSPGYVLEKKEVYEAMLRDTFNILVIPDESLDISSHMCQECIVKLQEATAFKQLVVESLQSYDEYLKKLQADLIIESDMKGEEINPASPMDYPEQNEISANLKTEFSHIEEDAILDSSSQEKYLHRSKTKRRNCKIKSGNIEKSIQKDWSKITERRGSGPILRENSLKLLSNSTLCVFQWDRSRYRCFCCKEPFPDIPTLRHHTHSTHTIQQIEKRIIAQQNRLVKVEISELNCRLCGEETADLGVLRQHLTSKHGFQFTTEDLLVPFKIETELACQICHERFDAFRLLNIHVNKHFLKQICHICGAGFSNLVFLNLHKTRTHRPLKCKFCDSVFSDKSERRDHQVSAHQVKCDRKYRFPCQYCDERFSQENSRVLHLVDRHGLSRPEYKCLVCSKCFVTKSLRNNHLKSVHLKERVHECDVCHRLFYSKSDVKRHKVTHTGERRFSCHACSSKFASKDSLRRHVKRNHGALQ